MDLIFTMDLIESDPIWWSYLNENILATLNFRLVQRTCFILLGFDAQLFYI